jgi:4-amino-4-deoxy-L-arabinose transferase-like glycosyltransferase
MAMLEPRIMEWMVSRGYQLAGKEDLRIPQLLSSIFWLVGGYFLYLIAYKTLSSDASVFALAFYLFLPFGVTVSMSFLPDILMIMLMLISIYLMLVYYQEPSMLKVLLAAFTASLAIFIKPLCVFVLFSLFISLEISRTGWRGVIRDKKFWIFVVSSLFLPIIYYFVYGVLIWGFVQGQAGLNRFGFLGQTIFWKAWFTMIWRTVGYLAIIGSLLSMLLLRTKLSQVLMAGLWLGYLLFGLVFNFKASSFDYYQLQLIPIVALSVAPVIAFLIFQLSQSCNLKSCRIIILEILLLALLLGIYQTRLRILDPDFDTDKIRIAQEVGDLVDHSTNTIFLASQSGKLLQYYGEISGSNWSDSINLALSNSQRDTQDIDKWLQAHKSDYFIITDRNDYQYQPALRQYLTEKYPLLIQTDEYLIFDLRGK